MTQLVEDIIRLSNEFGSDTEYSRAGGGNASVKLDDVLHIKPSGVALATLKADDLVPLRLPVLLDALYSDEPVEGDPVRVAAQAAQIGDAGGRRPSVEILFHALIDDPLVLHLHPLIANAVTCNANGPELLRKLLGDDAVWVDYTDPGVPLARKVASAREEFTKRTGQPAPGITLLGNHGIIVSGHTYDEVAGLTQRLTAAIRSEIDQHPAVENDPTRRVVAIDLAASYRTAVGAQAVAERDSGVAVSDSGLEAGPVGRGPLIPDQIVYAGSLPVILDGDEDASAVAAKVADFEAQHGRLPIIAVVPGTAVFAGGSDASSAENALETYLDALRVASDAERIGSVRVMTEAERHFIENWEAESYRRKVAAGN